MVTIITLLTAAVTFSNTSSIFGLARVLPFIVVLRCLFCNCGTESLLTCENVWMNHRQKSGDEGRCWRSVFRTSNGQCFSQQPVGLRRDGAVISWQRGAGHVGTARPTSKPGPTSRNLTEHTLFLPPGETSLRKKKNWSSGFGLIARPYECTEKEH